LFPEHAALLGEHAAIDEEMAADAADAAEDSAEEKDDAFDDDAGGSCGPCGGGFRDVVPLPSWALDEEEERRLFWSDEDPEPAEGPALVETSSDEAPGEDDEYKSDASSEEEGAPPLEKWNGIAGLRRDQPVTFMDDGDSGALRFKVSDGTVCAHCPRHGQQCRMTRTMLEPPTEKLRKLFPWRGRPCGFLPAWLLAANKFKTREAHRAYEIIPLDDRQEARTYLMLQPGSEDIMCLERDTRMHEPDEPIVFK
jgi:hypothetical protein